MGDTPFTPHLEGMALRDQNATRGGGYVEATVRDLGFAKERANGAEGAASRSGPWLRLRGLVHAARSQHPPEAPSWDWRRRRRILGATPSAQAPLTQVAPSSSKENTQGEATVVAEMPAAKAVGGGQGPSKHRALVKEIVEKRKMKLPEADKYIKEHNLYIKAA